jgi:hypothetical protein
MTKNSPALEEWRQLYEAVNRVKEVAPWQWMQETDMFGVQNPDTGELGFVSVMGMAGEHYAIAIYLGLKGLYGLLNFKNISPTESPELFLEIPLLQASFENRDELHHKDLEIIKELGLKFRGQNAWPMFRSFRPGFFPWFVEAGEARFLVYTLEQTLDVALRFRENPSLLKSCAEGNFLVRFQQKENEEVKWEDRMMQIAPPEPSTISIPMDVRVLEVLKGLQQGQFTIEIDFFMLTTPIAEKGSRPYYPYLLLMVDTKGKMILGYDTLVPDPSLEDMRGLIPLSVASQLARINIIPNEVKVRSELLLQMLQPLARELNFKLTHSRNLPSLDSAKASMLKYYESVT